MKDYFGLLTCRSASQSLHSVVTWNVFGTRRIELERCIYLCIWIVMFGWSEQKMGTCPLDFAVKHLFESTVTTALKFSSYMWPNDLFSDCVFAAVNTVLWHFGLCSSTVSLYEVILTVAAVSQFLSSRFFQTSTVFYFVRHSEIAQYQSEPKWTPVCKILFCS